MLNRIASVLAGVALAFGVGTAQAATYNVDLYGPIFGYSGDVDVVRVHNSTFSDTWNFELGENSNVWFGAATTSSKLDLSVKLFDSLDNLLAVGEEFEFGWGFWQISGVGLGPLLLEAGSYHFLVSSGNESYGYSTYGGKKKHKSDPTYYKFGVLAQVAPPTPVPLPPAMLLLATGLAGLGALARRRKAGAAMEPVAA